MYFLPYRSAVHVESRWRASASSEAVDSIKQYISGRMEQWAGARPWYGGVHTQESVGSELILSAQAMTEIDSSQGHAPSATTATVLGRLASAQLPDGSWDWLDYGLEPWESKGGKVFGSTMAALALGKPLVKADSRYQAMSTRLRGDVERGSE